MSFEFTAINYDSTRKLATTKQFKAPKTTGTVTGVTITNGGTGYTNPTLVFTGGGGTGAVGTITADATDGIVQPTVNMTNTGTGYTSTPTVTVKDGGSTGYNATATANVAASTTHLSSVFTPTPYNFDFTLSIMVRNSDDGTQILEQILPYFTPVSYTHLRAHET